MKKHIPIQGRLVTTKERAFELLNAVSDPDRLKTLCGYTDHFGGSYKYRVREDLRTHENIVPVEMRATDLILHTHGQKDVFVDRTEWFPLTNQCYTDQRYSWERDWRNAKEEGKEEPFKILRFKEDEELAWRMYMHYDNVEYCVNESDKKYKWIAENPHSIQPRSKDQQNPEGKEVKLTKADNVFYLVTPGGEILPFTWITPTEEGDATMLVIFCESFGGLHDPGYDSKWDMKLFTWMDYYESGKGYTNNPFTDSTDKFKLDPTDFETEIFSEYNDSLDDPYIMDYGEELRGEELHWVTGSEDDMLKEAAYLVHACVPYDPSNPDDSVYPVEFGITTDDDCGESARLDEDMGMDLPSVVDSRVQEEMQDIFEQLILEDNYPCGYEFEYNDQDGDRMSGYSKYSRYYSISIDAPKDQAAIDAARQWVRMTIENRWPLRAKEVLEDLNLNLEPANG